MISACRIRCMFTATISACREISKPRSMTIAAAEDLPLHLAHLQFYGYGKEGPHGFSSAAPRLAEAVNAANNVTIDVGQVMFGQTVTISSDVLRQFSARAQARPKKYAIIDGDSNGCGIVPYEYRAGSFHNAVQFAVGLELFLLIRRSMAGVLHHRSPERRAVHDLSGDLRAADGQGRARGMDVAPARRSAGGDDASLDHARIYLKRNRDDDPRGAGANCSAFPTAAIWAKARAQTSRSTGRARTSRRCSAPRRASTRTANSWCATARSRTTGLAARCM